LLAVLPGSRANEIRFLGETFLDAVERLCRERPALSVVIPAATPARRRELEALLAPRPSLAGRVTLIDGRSREAMVASDAVLLASGTAALEAMLCHRAMLVAYKMAPATHWLAKRLVNTEWISLPNLIARETLVPELIQDAASPEAIAAQLAEMLDDEPARKALEARFASMHAALQRDASRRASEAIEALVAGRALPASVAPEAGEVAIAEGS
jgi:lipid-A-disaccharide synthase